MKNIFLSILVFISLNGIAQTFPITQNLGSRPTKVETAGTLSSLTGFVYYSFSDTTEANIPSYIRFTPGITILTGYSTFWVRNAAASQWVQISGGSSTKALNGTTLAGDTVILGGTTLDRYTAIGLNGYPLTLNHNAVNNANQSDSNSLRLTNNTVATSGTDSLVSPSLIFKTSGWRASGGGSSKDERFRIDVFGGSGGSNGEAFWRLSANPNNTGYSTLYSINSTGVFMQPVIKLSTIQIGERLIASSGVGNLVFGNGAMPSISSGTGNIAIGTSAMQNTIESNNSIAIGNSALLNNDSTFNIAIGSTAMQNNTTGHYNTAVGSQAMLTNTTGMQNAAFGMNALVFNTTGSKNTAIGPGAGEDNTTGSFNTFIGHDAGLHNTIGELNVAVGWLSWAQNITGDQNVGLGANTGQSVVYGYHNVAIGNEAMYLDMTGINQQEDSVTNSIALGAHSYTTASNQMRLGNDSINDTRIYGIAAGVGTVALRYDPTTKQVFYADTTAGGGATPTFDATLIQQGATPLSQSHTVDGGGFNYIHNNIGTLEFRRGVETNARLQFGVADTRIRGAGASSPYINLGASTINISLPASSTSLDNLLGWYSADGEMNKVTVGSGLSLSSGVLSATGGSTPMSSITAATGTNTIDNGTFAQEWQWNGGVGGGSALSLTSATTGAVNGDIMQSIILSGANASSGVTTYGMNIVNTHSGTSSKNIGLSITTTSATTNYAIITGTSPTGLNTPTPTAGILHIVAPTTTATTTSAGVVEAMNSLTSGTGHYISTSSQTSGNALQIVGTSTALAANNELLDISLSGANGTNGITATGARISVTNTNAISGTNVGLDVTATGATTANYALKLVDGSQGAGKVLTSDANGNASWATPSGSTTWNGITNPTGDQALTFDAGESSTWTNSNTTEDLFTINNSTATTGKQFVINSTSTAKTMGNALSVHSSSGANATSGITIVSDSINVSNTGTSSKNVGLKINVSGATTNVPISTNVGDLMDFGTASQFYNNTAVTSNTSGLWFLTDNGAGASSGTIKFLTGSLGMEISSVAGTKTRMDVIYGGNHGYLDNGTHFSIYPSAASQELRLGSGGTENYITIQPDGDVGVKTATPTSVLHTTSFATAYRALTALRTLDATDHTIEVTANTFNVTLPTAVGITGRQYVITNSGSGVVTLATTSSETFVNVTATPTTLTINQFNTVTVVSNGANWLRTTSL